MNKNVGEIVSEIIDIVSNAKTELNNIQSDWVDSNVSDERTRSRIKRWRERLLHKLSPHLVNSEIKQFQEIASDEDDISDTLDELSGYLVELNDDLDNLPDKVVKDVPNKTISPNINVFISYAWANENVVLAIDQWLRNKEITTKIDKRDFFAGSRIRDEIIRVMSKCKVILIFHSQQSKDKPWVDFERELAADIEMLSKTDKKKPPRIIYVVIDDTPLPNISAKSKIAVIAKGKKFDDVCEEIYRNILQIPKSTAEIDLEKWNDYTF